MYDLLAVAYQADVTRVFTFMLSRELSQRTYPNIGVTEQHHSVSHHGNDPEKIAQNVKVNTYHMTLFAKFLEKLQLDARRRRLAARSLADLLRRRHGQSERHASDPLPVRRRRRRRRQGTPPHQADAADAGRQPVAGGRQQVRQPDRDASATATDASRISSLMRRAMRYVPRVVARRSAVGASLSADGSESRLAEAIQAGDREAVRQLLQGPGGGERRRGRRHDAAALGRARRRSRDRRRRCSAPAPTRSAANRYGVTPLSLAAVNGNAAMIEALLAAGAERQHDRLARDRPC